MRLGEAAVGSTSAFTSSPNTQLDLAATLEPDCDGDGFGDETQDVAVDCVPPDTLITKQPKARTHKRKTTFEFSSSESNSSFECSFRGQPFGPCTSPETIKAHRGVNTYAVRARDAAGNVDPSPASVEWKFKKKK